VKLDVNDDDDETKLIMPNVTFKGDTKQQVCVFLFCIWNFSSLPKIRICLARFAACHGAHYTMVGRGRQAAVDGVFQGFEMFVSVLESWKIHWNVFFSATRFARHKAKVAITTSSARGWGTDIYIYEWRWPQFADPGVCARAHIVLNFIHRIVNSSKTPFKHYCCPYGTRAKTVCKRWHPTMIIAVSRAVSRRRSRCRICSKNRSGFEEFFEYEVCYHCCVCRILQNNKLLAKLYEDLVATKVMPASEFWSDYSATKVCVVLKRICLMEICKLQSADADTNSEQATGISAAFLTSIKESDGCNNIRLNLTTDTIRSIFSTYPNGVCVFSVNVLFCRFSSAYLFFVITHKSIREYAHLCVCS
jgi:hypothetical protein